MCGDHRRHQCTGQCLGHGRGVELGHVELQVGGGQAAVLGRLARSDADCAPPFAMDVFGDVGEQREMGEGADDGNGLVDVDAVEHPGELCPVDLRAAHPERLDAGPLDEVEDRFPVLLPHGVTEDGSEKPDVLTHGLGGFAADLGAAHGADRRQRDVGSVSHHPSIGDRQAARRAGTASVRSRPARS